LIRNFLSAWLGGAILAVVSLQTNAAGLGSLEVKSVLGEPLRAEVPVTATADELPSLKARLASPSAFEAAGLVYTGLVSQLSVTLKKDGGEPVLLITSAKPINEPVVDLLLELTWASGRVTHEYTAFIDPPFIAAEREKSMAEQAATTEQAAKKNEPLAETSAANLPDAPTPKPLPAEGEAKTTAPTEPASTEKPESVTVTLNDRVEETEIAPVETIGGTGATLFDAEPGVTPPSATGKTAPATAMAPDTGGKKIGVIRGDTLSKIALANKPQGVTLEQMLVVLFRNNPTAFSGKNMNRLRTGKVIQLGDAEEYKSVTQSQALKEVRVQYSDWNGYRERVAAAAASKQMAMSEQPAQQAAAGTVTPKVEDRAPKATEQPSEVVKLSKGQPASGGTGQGDVQALQEKLVSSEKALQESNARVARLEKIIEDLQKLAEVKNQDLAQLQSQAAKTPGAAATAPTPAKPEAADTKPAPAKPEAAATPESGKPAAPTDEKPTPAPAPAPAANAPATTVQKPAPAPAAPADKAAGTPAPAAQKPPRRPAPPPPPPPASLLDRLLAQPYLLAVPLVVLLLIGFGVTRLRNRKREPKEGSDEVAPAKSLKAAKKSGKSGAFAPTETDVGLASRGSGNGSDEVDPLEEAEIFLAYGRDAQAEELLKEALETHPARFDIHAKLAEIYAKRRDQKAFENLAKQVQQGTGGEGEIWDRVVRLGYSIDPENPRYADGKTDDQDFDGTASQPPDNLTSTVDRLDFEVGGDGDDVGFAPDFDPSATSEFQGSQIVDPEATMEGSIDDAPTMKIDMGDAGLTATDLDLNAELPVLDGDETDTHTVDFESTQIQMPGEPDADEITQDSAMDFNLDGLSLGSDSDEESSDSAEDTATDMPALDLSGISLDLDGATTTHAGGSASKDEKWYEVQTKFDLAKAYQEMGDNDGAKEILQEVISEGDSEQKAAAESVLASLG